MSPTRTRAAANAGARPEPRDASAWTEAVNRSGCPGELRLREPGLPFELDAEGADL